MSNCFYDKFSYDYDSLFTRRRRPKAVNNSWDYDRLVKLQKKLQKEEKKKSS